MLLRLRENIETCKETSGNVKKCKEMAKHFQKKTFKGNTEKNNNLLCKLAPKSIRKGDPPRTPQTQQ